MLLYRKYSTSISASKLNWRTQIKENQLISQISSILLQRNNWIPLIESLNLSSSKLTPSLVHQILNKTQNNPQISLKFYNYAIDNLNFTPDLKSQCQIINISLGSNLTNLPIKILNSVIQKYPSSMFLDTFIHVGENSKLDYILSFVLEFYCNKGLFLDGLKVYNKMRDFKFLPLISSCNVLLDVLLKENEVKLVWCFYCSMIRFGVLLDKFTWSLIANVLFKEGKFERIVKFLDIGVCNSFMYNVVIDWYSRNGDFESAFFRLNEMSDRRIDAGFSTYSSILDGACKCGNVEVIERVMGMMVEKELLPKCDLSDCDLIIQRFCDLGKVYALKMFYERVCCKKIRLQDATYGCMLRAFSKEGMLEEAVGLYRIIVEKGISTKNSSYGAFVDLLSENDEFAEGYEILMEIMKRGFVPCTSSLSKFISSLCGEHRWIEAEELLYMLVEKELLPDSSSCCSLIKHYCSSRQIDKAITLHNKLQKLKGGLDLVTYNKFIDRLLKAGRVEESGKVFDYMKGLELVNSTSFAIIIRGLCRAKELRKAMKLHDEMLSVGLKPDKPIYQRLILEFKQ